MMNRIPLAMGIVGGAWAVGVFAAPAAYAAPATAPSPAVKATPVKGSLNFCITIPMPGSAALVWCI
jgi:hypothetical protein